MDFSAEEYTEEQEEFAKEVRKWLDENAPKDVARPWDTRKMSYEQWQERRDFGRRLGRKGWLWATAPSKYGGGGLDADHGAVISRELTARKLSAPPYYDSNVLAVPAILGCATEEQKNRFLLPIFKGEIISWQLFTEPEAGTDEANQQTKALRHVRDKDHFVVNGQKIFVGSLHPPQPDRFLLLTRSDTEAPRHENLAMFLAPADLPGITIVPLDLFPSGNISQIGSGPGRKNQVFFDDVRIHESCLIGGDHDGWRATNATLAVEHGDRQAAGTADQVPAKGGRDIARNALVDEFLDQCKNNPNVARRLKENPHLLDSVVNAYVGAEIQRLWSIRNTGLAASGRRIPGAGPQLNLYAKVFGNRVVADMAKVLGPYTLTDDDEWELNEGIFEVGQRGAVCIAPGGTPEALKIVISRALAIGR